jgi:hypothetical protein
MAFGDMPDRGRLMLSGAHDITDRMLAMSKDIVPGIRADLDVPYGEDFYQKLDIFLPAEEGLRALPENAIKACLPMSAVFDLRLDRFPAGGTREKGALNLLVDASDGSDATPAEHTAGNRTPFYLSYGSDDTDDIKTDAATMVLLLDREAGVVEVEVFDGLSHFATNEAYAAPDFAWIRKARAWLSAPPVRP